MHTQIYTLSPGQGPLALPTDSVPPSGTIFYFKALAVVSVVHAASRMQNIPRCLLVYSDNTNTVNIFHSLRALPPYNDLLKFTVSILMDHDISLRVIYVPGADNIIADSLSRFENTKALAASGPPAQDSRSLHFNPHVYRWGRISDVPGVRYLQATC